MYVRTYVEPEVMYVYVEPQVTWSLIMLILKSCGLWSLIRGGLFIEVKMHCKATIGTRPSGPLWSLNTGGHKSRFYCTYLVLVAFGNGHYYTHYNTYLI